MVVRKPGAFFVSGLRFSGPGSWPRGGLGIIPIEMAMKNVYTMVNAPNFQSFSEPVRYIYQVIGNNIFNILIRFPEIDSTVGLNDAQAVADDDPCFLL